MKFKILDGAVNLVNGDPLTFPYTTTYGDAEPFALRFKVKEGLSSLWVNFLRDTDHLTAVDWGLDEPIDRDPFSADTKPCGEEVTLFFRPVENTFDSGIYLDAYEFSRFLSQIEILYTPFPNWFGASQTLDLAIDSPKFTAPKGMFENIDLIPTFNTTVPDYSGNGAEISSTFEIGPRIWVDLKDVAYFPGPIWGEYQVYAPFKDIPSLKSIEPQGQFGDELEKLSATDFMLTDEDGYADPSAYPSGGAPRQIKKYCVPVDKFSFDKGYTYPQFNMERCEIFSHGSDIKRIDIGQFTSASSVTMPAGINFNESKVLEVLEVNLPKINIKSGNFTGNFWYGTKALGIKVPDTVQYAFGIYALSNDYVAEGVDRDGQAPLFPWFKDGNLAARPLTPHFIKTKLSFDWGSALEAIFDPEEELTLPNVPSGLLSVNKFAKNITIEAGATRISKKADGSWGYYSPPALPEGCKNILGYCENLHRNSTLGAVSYLMLDGENAPITVNDTLKIKKLPQSSEIVTDFLKNTFTGVRGNSLTEIFTDTTQVQSRAILFYGEPGADDEYGTGMTAVANFVPHDDDTIVQEYGIAYHGVIGNAAQYMQNMIDNTSQQDSFTVDICEGGIEIEYGPLPNLLFAPDWMYETWMDATINPKTLGNLIVPLPESTKSENAYTRACAIASPRPTGQLRIENFHTYGSKPGEPPIDPSNEQDWQGYTRYCSLAIWDNPFSAADLTKYVWHLEDLTLPDFIGTNMDSRTYAIFQGIFQSYYGSIFGSGDEFFNRFGVDETITNDYDRMAYVGLRDAEFEQAVTDPYSQIAFTWKRMQSIDADDAGRWISLPQVLEAAPEIDGPRDGYVSPYVYPFEWALLKNDKINQENLRYGVSDADGAMSFRNLSANF